jgi:hypothetical protein
MKDRLLCHAFTCLIYCAIVALLVYEGLKKVKL